MKERSKPIKRIPLKLKRPAIYKNLLSLIKEIYPTKTNFKSFLLGCLLLLTLVSGVACSGANAATPENPAEQSQVNPAPEIKLGFAGPLTGGAAFIGQEQLGFVKAAVPAGRSHLYVEQNVNMALSVAHRGYVLQTGRVVLADQADRLLNNEQMRQAYLGR